MTIPFVAILQSNITRERGIRMSAQTLEEVERQAKNWLDSFGEPGDRFDVYVVEMKSVSVIECLKKPAPAPPRANGLHEFKPASRSIRCDVCGDLEGAHR